jgi:hypothetical protein
VLRIIIHKIAADLPPAPMKKDPSPRRREILPCRILSGRLLEIIAYGQHILSVLPTSKTTTSDG